MAVEVQFLQELFLPQYHKTFQMHGRKQMLQSGLSWRKWTAVCHRLLWLDECKITVLKQKARLENFIVGGYEANGFQEGLHSAEFKRHNDPTVRKRNRNGT